MKLYDIIKALQNAKGSLEKQAIMDANKDDALFKAYMKATYDVSLNYYMKKVPEVFTVGDIDVDISVINGLVDDIAGRTFTGKEAKHLVQVAASMVNAEGQELMQYILDRSIGASVGDTMVLKTWLGLYFSVPYMRCAGMSEKARENFDKQEYFYVQTKRDGSFAYAQRSFEGCRVVTRQGSLYPLWFADRMTTGLEYGVALVGEMEVLRNGKLLSRKDGNGVLNSVLSGEDEAAFEQYEFKYVAWDALSATEFADGKSNRPYSERLTQLAMMVGVAHGTLQMLQVELIKSEKVTSVAQAKEIHRQHTARGDEGTVWKTPDGIWKNTSSGTLDAVKVKVVFEAEYEITGYYEGEGKAKGMLGGITVKTSCGKLVNNCGSGFDDPQRKMFWERRDELIGRICTLEANDVITSRTKTTVALSLPIFIEMRHDRTEADSLERVLEQLEAAKQGREV